MLGLNSSTNSGLSLASPSLSHGCFLLWGWGWVFPWHSNDLENLRVSSHWQAVVHYQCAFLQWTWHDTKPGCSNKRPLYQHWLTHIMVPSGNKLIRSLSPCSQTFMCFWVISDSQVNAILAELVPPVEGAGLSHPFPSSQSLLSPPLSRLEVRCCVKRWW